MEIFLTDDSPGFGNVFTVVCDYRRFSQWVHCKELGGSAQAGKTPVFLDFVGNMQLFLTSAAKQQQVNKEAEQVSIKTSVMV
jgi:hypothetical protein